MRADVVEGVEVAVFSVSKTNRCLSRIYPLHGLVRELRDRGDRYLARRDSRSASMRLARMLEGIRSSTSPKNPCTSIRLAVCSGIPRERR